MRFCVLVSTLGFLAASAQQPVLADPFPDETPAVALNRNLEMVAVKGGCYRMGSDAANSARDERPVHDACVKDFLLGMYEVTQMQWISVMGKNPSSHADCGDGCPVDSVSWNDVQEFLRRLNERTNKRYRLPTEAEWEYAARSGGRDDRWAGTSDDKQLGEYAWFLNNSKYVSHPAGAKKPNALGLYDMTGNVWEWVSDWYGEDFYAKSPKDAPQGPPSGRTHVLRGGYWGDTGGFARVTRRIGLPPDAKGAGYGFRVAMSPE